MSSTLAFILTDTHLEAENAEVNKAVFKESRDLAKEAGLKKIYHGGDIFNSRKAQPQDILNAFGTILDEFEADGMELVAIPGNHDKTNYHSEASFLDPFKHHPAFHLIRQPMIVDVYNKEQVSISMAPFFADEEYIASIEGEFKKSAHKRVLLTHIGVNGAVMNNGMKVSSQVTEALFKIFDKVLIGHYHDASVFSKKIEYIGSSVQHNFGETPNKGLTILYDDLTIGTIELVSFPKYITKTFDVKDLTSKKIEQLKQDQAITDNRLRIVLTGAEEKIKAFDKQRLAEFGVKVTTKQDLVKVEELEERIEAFDSKSIASAFETFCVKNSLDHPTGLKYLNPIL